jgi:oxygen-independent coproporphyrinogen-3 oxidase
MAGLYIHIPFCRRACYYCNFHFSVNLSRMKDMLQAIALEAQTEAPAWSDVVFNSLYLGGGTPSLIPPDDLIDLLSALKKEFRFAADAEFTLEANPDDVSAEKATGWKAAGINRASLGIQSFSDEELTWMNRAHQASQSEVALDALLSAGIASVNVDLIYGSPLLSDEAWRESLRRVFAGGADHLSAYALTLEADTPYKKLVQQGKYPAPDEERQARHFDMLLDEAAAAGWEHYEISNLCRPGKRARHNSAYWHNEAYLGLGPAAHSHEGNRRWWNVADNLQYLKQAESGNWERGSELLTPAGKLNEFLMTHIRLMEGLNLQAAEQMLPGFSETRMSALLEFEAKGWAFLQEDVFRLSKKGKHYADAIASALMEVEED